jgi:hypothetical protein
MTVLAEQANAFLHFDMGANRAFKRQKYKAYTGKHGIERTGQEKLFYADLLACIAYVSEYHETPDFVVVAGGAPGKVTCWTVRAGGGAVCSTFKKRTTGKDRLPQPGQLNSCLEMVKAENS